MGMQDLRIKTYAVSLGCAKNRVDTEKMLATLGRYYLPVKAAEEAQLVLVNTCAFIEPAVEESIQQILVLAQELEKVKPRPLLVVTGCLPARYGTEIKKEMPEVDLWLGFEEQANWLDSLQSRLNIFENQRSSPDPGFEQDSSAAGCQTGLGRVLSTPPGYAYLKISEGCHRKCSFCLIPKIRGPMASRPGREILQEARLILDQSVRELCLVAQDLTAYGRDLKQGMDLQRLLSGLCELQGLQWLRLLYLYPAGLNKRLLAFLRKLSPPLLPYFDIPLQHADPEILSNMGRPFAKDPQNVLNLVREWFPGASLRTSLIVGFPGETAACFDRLLDFVQRAQFDHLGVFAFSPEQGVQAASFDRQVPEAEKQRRKKELLALQQEISRNKLAAMNGQQVQVMIDAAQGEWPTLYQGRTWFQAPEADGITYVSGQDIQPGQIVQAQVVESKIYDLVALA